MPLNLATINSSAPTHPAYAYVPTAHYHALPVDWRWERAKWLNNQALRCRKHDDEFVRLARKFIGKLSNDLTDADLETIAVKFPGIFWAWHWHDHDPKSPMRWAIEAYLCAGATCDQIAQRLGVSPEVILLYERLFFNVRDKLQYTSYMIAHAMRGAVERGLSDRPADLLWKLFGYLKGPLFLDYFIPGCDDFNHAKSREEVPDARASLMRGVLSTRALVAARTVSTVGNEQFLIEQYHKMVELEKLEGLSGPSILNNIQAVIQNIGFERYDPQAVAEGAASKYADKSFELRTAERLALAVGDDVNANQWQNVKFPAAGSASAK